MSTNDHFSKISLSKNELAHVYQQLFLASQAKIKQMLPESQPEDELMISAQNKMTFRLASTFESAKYALVVDGKDLASFDDVSVAQLLSIEEENQVAPLDTKSNQELRDLVEMVEKETTEVTQLRRQLPMQAREAYKSLVTSTDRKITDIVSVIDRLGDETGDYSSTDDPNIAGSNDASQSFAEVLKNGDLAGLDSKAIKDLFPASVVDLYATKQEIPELDTLFKNMNDTAQVALASLERSMKEPRIYADVA